MEDKFEIVPFREWMCDQALAIWNEVIKEGEAFVYEIPAEKEAFLRMLNEQSAVTCIVDGERLCGFYILHPNWPGRGAHTANASYAVSSSYRGQGVGRKLGEYSLEQAKHLGFDAMQFNAVVATNNGARRLWESLGFEKIGEAPKAFIRKNGDRVSLILYHKFL